MTKAAVIIILLIGSTCFGAASSQKGFKIETSFEYQSSGKTTKTQSNFILAKDNRAWTTLVEPKNGVALLGRLAKSDRKSLHLEYIVVDTNRNNSVISTPAIISKLGEKAEVTVDSNSDQDKVSISLLATETEYTSNQ